MLDLQAGGELVRDVDPWEIATNIEDRYQRLWQELTAEQEFQIDEFWRIEQRIERLHELGFDVAEMDLVADEAGRRLRGRAARRRERLPPGAADVAHRTVGPGEPGPPAAQRHPQLRGRDRGARVEPSPPENVTAVRWLDQRFTPTIESIPPDVVGKLQDAEIYHQILEHRWFLSERTGHDVPTEEAVKSYVNDILRPAPDEQQGLEHTGQLRLEDIENAGPSSGTAAPT